MREEKKSKEKEKIMIKKIALAFLVIVMACAGVKAESIDVVDLAKVGTLGQIKKEITQQKKNIDRWDKDGNTPLMAAARWNPDKQVLGYLINSGARLEAKNLKGETALIKAARYNPNIEIVLTLTRRGANVNIKDDMGRTALMWAVLENINPVEIVEILKIAGANINLKDNKGKTAWQYAKEKREYAVALRPYLEEKKAAIKKTEKQKALPPAPEVKKEEKSLEKKGITPIEEINAMAVKEEEDVIMISDEHGRWIKVKKPLQTD